MLHKRSMMKSKLHRATVTQADLEYEGSLTLDRLFLQAADILPFEEVHVWNVTRGTRFCTYAIEGEAGSGVVCVNGAAAHLASAGDVIIVATFTWMDEPTARHHQPRVVLLRNNRIVSQSLPEIPGPSRRRWDTVLCPEDR
jgi:aspartate 1-decarboxylase